jgi:hypothetical protein
MIHQALRYCIGKGVPIHSQSTTRRNAIAIGMMHDQGMRTPQFFVQ